MAGIIGTAEVQILANTAGFASSLKKGVGVGVAALGATVAGVVGTSIKQFGEFEEGINEVFTLLGADAPTATLDGIEQATKDLATTFGLDLQDAITGTYDAISAGVDTSNLDEFEGFTETAAKFAQAGATDFGTSIDLLTTATNAFGIEASDVDQVADTLFATIQGGKCLRLDQRVLTVDRGYVPIGELTEGAMVWAWDGDKFVESWADFVPQPAKETVRVTTKSGRSIVTTWNHPYLTETGEWVEVQDLDEGDAIAVPVEIPQFGCRRVDEHKSATLGLWLADGASSLRGGPRITSRQYGDDIKQWGAGWGLNCRNIERREDEAPTWALSHPSNNRWNPNPLTTWLRELGLGDCKAGTKHVPREVFSDWNRDSVALFLYWLFSGDGWLSERKPRGHELGYSSKSERLVRDVSHLLMRFGIAGTVRQRQNGWVWQTRRWDQIRKFVDEISIDRPGAASVPNGPTEKNKNYHAAPHGVILFDPIVSIESEGMAEVADLTVPGLHNFVAEDIVAHNTTADELAASLFQVAPIAAAAGVSLEETSAGLATLTAQGVPTKAAATQLKAAFSELSKSGTVADKAFRDLSGVGFAGFLDQGGSVQEAFNLLRGAADEGGFAVTDLFGSIEAGAAVLGTTGDQADRFAGNLDNIMNAAGATDDAFARMDSGIFASFRQIRATISVAFIEIGQALAPFVGAIADALETRLPDLFGSLGDAVGGLSDRLLPVFEQITTGVGGFFSALSGEGVTSGGIVGVFERIGVAINEFRSNLDFGGAFDGLFSGIGDGGGIVDTLTSIADSAIAAAPAIAELVSNFAQLGGSQLRAVIQIFSVLAPIIAELASVLLPAITAIAGAFGAILEVTPAPVLAATAVAFVALNTAMKANAAISAAGGIKKLIANTRVVTAVTKAWGVATGAVNAVLKLNTSIVAAGGITAYIRSANLAARASGLWAAAQRALRASFLTNPIFLTVAAIAALVAIIVVAYRESETFRNFVDGLFESIQPLIDAVKVLGGALGDLFTGDFSGAFDGLKEAGDLLGPFFSDLGASIGGLLINGLKDAAAAIGLDNILDFDQIGRSIRAGLDDVFAAVGSLGDAFSALFSGDFSGAFNGLLDAAGNLVSGFGTLGLTLFNALFDGLQGGLDAIGLGFLADILEPVQTIFNEIVSSVIAFGSAFATAADGVTSSGLAGVFERLAIAVRGVFDIGVKVVEIFANLFTGDFSGALDALEELGDLIGPVLLNIGRFAGEALIEALTGALDLLGLDFLIEPVEDALNAVGDFITDRAPGVFEGIGEAAGVAFDVVVSVIETAIDVVTTIFNGLETIWDTGILQSVFGAWWAYVKFIWGLIVAVVEEAIEQVGDVISTIQDVWNSDFVQSVFDNVAEGFQTAWNIATGVIETAVDVIQAVLGFFGLGGGSGDSIGDTISAVFDTVAEGFQAAWDTATTVIDVAVDAVQAVLGFFGIGEGSGDSLGQTIGAVFNAMADDFQVAWDAASAVIGTAVDVIQGILGFFGIGGGSGDSIGDTLGAIWDQAAENWEKAWDALGPIVQTAVDGITITIDTVVTIWEGLITTWEFITSEIGRQWANLSAAAATVWASLRDNVVAPVAELKDTVLRIFGEIRDEGERIFILARIAAINVWNGFKDLVLGIVASFKDGVIGFFQEIRDFVNGFLDRIGIGTLDISGITGPIQSALDKIQDLLDIIGKIPTSISLPSIPNLPSIPGSSTARNVASSVFRRFALGGLATEPSIAGEAGPELILPFAHPDRMKTLLASFAPDLASSVGGFDELINLLSGDNPGDSTSRAVPGPFGGSTSSSSSNQSADRTNTQTSTTTTTNVYNFHGAEAAQVAKQIRDRDKDVVSGIRIRS